MIVMTIYKGSFEIFPVESFKYFIENIFDKNNMSGKIYVLSSKFVFEQDIGVYFRYIQDVGNSYHTYLQANILSSDQQSVTDTLAEFSGFYFKSIKEFDRIEYIYDLELNIMKCVRYNGLTKSENNRLVSKEIPLDLLPEYNVKCPVDIELSDFDIMFFRMDLQDTYQKFTLPIMVSRKRKRADDLKKN